MCCLNDIKPPSINKTNQEKKKCVPLNRFKRFGSYNTVEFLIGISRHCTSPGELWENNAVECFAATWEGVWLMRGCSV